MLSVLLALGLVFQLGPWSRGHAQRPARTVPGEKQAGFNAFLTASAHYRPMGGGEQKA